MIRLTHPTRVSSLGKYRLNRASWVFPQSPVPSCRGMSTPSCFRILDSANSSIDLKLKEAFYISNNKPDLNKQLHHFNTFLRLVFRMRNRSLVSEREFTRLVTPSLVRKLFFVFPLTNAQLDLTKRKISWNGSANVKYSEAMRDEIMSTACGASIFVFELF